MSCPNVNHPDWKKLVSEVGENRAWEIFLENGKEVPAQSDRLGYMNSFFKGKEEDLMFKDDTEQVLNKLASITGISWKWDASLAPNITGNWNPINGVSMNPAAMKPDGPWHEYLHPIVEVIYQSNKPLWEEMKRKLNETPQGKFVRAGVLDDYAYKEDSELFYKEAITTFLGNIAAAAAEGKSNSLWTKLLDYVKLLFNKVFGNQVDLSKIDASISLRQLTKELLVEGTKPINLPYASSITGNLKLTLIEAGAINAKNEIVDYPRLQRIMGPLEANWPGAIVIDSGNQKVSFIEMQKIANPYNEGEFVKSKEDSDFYENSSGKKIKAVGKKMREMSASPEVRELSDAEYKERMAEVQADAKFQGQNKETYRVQVNGEYISYEEYKQYRREQGEVHLKMGRARHKAVEVLVALAKGSEKSQVQKLQKELVEIAGMDSNYIYNSIVSPYRDGDSIDYSAISRDFGYRPMDNDEMFSERVLTNEELGIGGTTDIYVEHANGFASILDIKTGDGMANKTPILFEGTDDVTMSPEEFAKLQVTFYALLAKSKNKDLKFRKLGVMYSKESSITNLNVDLTRYLPIIKHKLEKEGKTEWVKKNQDLFNAQNYYGIDAIQSELEDLQGMSIEELETAILEKIKSYDGKRKDISNIKFSNLEREQIDDIKKQLTNYLRAAVGNTYNLEDARDMQYMYSKFGDLMNVKNERLQAFSKLFYRAYAKYWDTLQAKVAQHERLMNDLIKESSLGTVDKVTGLISKADPKKVVGFMWVQDGERWRIISKNDPQYEEQVNSKAKKAYHDYYTKTLNETYDKATTRFQKAQLAKKYSSLNEAGQELTFYVSMDNEEKRSIEGMKSAFKARNDIDFKKKAIRMLGFKEATEGVSQNQQGVSVNNLDYKSDHTFDTEVIFFKAMENLEWKARMDDVYGIGKLFANIMQDEKDIRGNVIQQNNLKFLEDKLNLLILKEKKTMTTLMSYKVKDEKGVIKKVELTLDTVLDGLRRWTTLAVMPLRPVLFVRNFLMEQHFNIIHALKGSWAKRSSMIKHKEYIDYTTSDFIKANVIMFRSLYDPKVKKKKNAIMEKYKFSVDFNYDFDNTRRKLSTSLLQEKYLYITSKIGEDYNAQTVALSIMAHDGMWDQHDENGNYTGESRGVYQIEGRDIKLEGYNPEESRRIREVIKRIHGSYSEDQKSNIEAMAIGRMAMQFQKYKVNYISRAAIGRYKNDALGRFIKTGELNADGEPIFEWEKQEDSGWLRLLGRYSVIFSPHGLDLLRNGELQKELGLSDIEKQNMMEMAVSAALFMITMAGLALWFDPDDDDKNKKNFIYKNLLRLKGDILSAYNPVALVQESKHPLIAMGLISDVFKNLDDLATLERYKRSSKRYGYDKGDLKFMRTVKRRFMPMASTYREMQVLIGFMGGDVNYEYQFHDIETDFGNLESKEFMAWWGK